MVLVQVIPVHFINSNSKHALEVTIDALGDDTSINKFINVESRSVAVVEDEWMAKWFSPHVVGLF